MPLQLHFTRQNTTGPSQLDNIRSILQDDILRRQFRVGIEDLFQNSSMATADIHQLGNPLLILFGRVLQRAKVKVTNYRDGDINTRHALLESLELFRIPGHDTPDWGAVQLVVEGEGVVERVVGFFRVGELAASFEVVVEVVHVLEPLVVPVGWVGG